MDLNEIRDKVQNQIDITKTKWEETTGDGNAYEFYKGQYLILRDIIKLLDDDEPIQYFKSQILRKRTPCICECHTNRNIRHIVSCCDGGFKFSYEAIN